MRLHYANTFIRVAPDSTAPAGTVPRVRVGRKTLALIQYELVAAQPYGLTHGDVLWQTHVLHKGLKGPAVSPAARAAYLARDRACMRASPLPKRYGWGLHFNAEGRVKLIGVETAAYARLAAARALTVVDAMRSRRA